MIYRGWLRLFFEFWIKEAREKKQRSRYNVDLNMCTTKPTEMAALFFLKPFVNHRLKKNEHNFGMLDNNSGQCMERQ